MRDSYSEAGLAINDETGNLGQKSRRRRYKVTLAVVVGLAVFLLLMSSMAGPLAPKTLPSGSNNGNNNNNSNSTSQTQQQSSSSVARSSFSSTTSGTSLTQSTMTTITSSKTSTSNWIPNGVVVSLGISNSTSSKLGVDAKNVYVVWQGEGSAGHQQVFFSVSHDNGTTFSTPVNLSNDSGNAQLPLVATRFGNVYVIWQDTTPGYAQLFYAVSHDAGTTWNSPTNLSNDTGSVDSTSIISVSSDVFVTWSDDKTMNDQVYFKMSLDNGTTFGPTQYISNDGRTARNPHIASQLGYVFVLWEDNSATGNFQMMLRTSNDTGNSFGSAINLSQDAGDASHATINSHLGNKGSNVYVVWEDNSSGHYQIIFTASHDNGSSWSAPRNLSSSEGDATNPEMSSHGGNIGQNVYVVWQDKMARSQIFYALSRDNGTSWSIPINISDDPNLDAIDPVITARNRSQNISITWESVCICNKNQVMLSSSADGGSTFNVPSNLSNDAGNAFEAGVNESPSTGDNAYVVWVDNTSGTYQIVVHKLA